MLPLLLLASIPSAMISAYAAGPDSAEQVVRQSANGEFILSHYPPGALKRGEQGKVAFRLMIEPDGSLGTCDVTESSGFARLDKETCEVMMHARLKPVRSSDGRAIRAVQSGYIVWKLPDGATRVASTGAKTMPKPDQLICRRIETTGSLIARTKQCLTRTEWARQEQQTRDEMDRLQGRAHSCGGNGQCPNGL
jgi:TonB family protein